jgi:FkbH-like protein
MTAYGLLDTSRATGQVDAIDEINRKLRRAFREMTDVHWLDYDEVQARHGRQRWLDAKKWATARLPFSVSALPVMAAEWWRHLTPVVLPAAKVMVLDLDNTLWGGTVGEDGLSGLKLGNEYPGIFFRDLQQAVLDIAARGVMIAVASKNNEADALQVFDEHPDMLITRDQIAAKRINWSPKPDNLVEIAQELNLGLDAFVFIDDNPVEREAVRRALPEVHVIDLPADPAGYANALRSAAVLERYTLSAEDRKRDIYYRDEKLRRDAIAQADDMESFLRSLAIEVDVAPVDPLSVPRAAQLTQKTNQLNTTTMRCTESDIQAMTQDSARRVLTLHARDRFGDNGIVGVAICRLGDKHCEIENLLRQGPPRSAAGSGRQKRTDRHRAFFPLPGLTATKLMKKRSIGAVI